MPHAVSSASATTTTTNAGRNGNESASRRRLRIRTSSCSASTHMSTEHVYGEHIESSSSKIPESIQCLSNNESSCTFAPNTSARDGTSLDGQNLKRRTSSCAGAFNTHASSSRDSELSHRQRECVQQDPQTFHETDTKVPSQAGCITSARSAVPSRVTAYSSALEVRSIRSFEEKFNESPATNDGAPDDVVRNEKEPKSCVISGNLGGNGHSGSRANHPVSDTSISTPEACGKCFVHVWLFEFACTFVVTMHR